MIDSQLGRHVKQIDIKFDIFHRKVRVASAKKDKDDEDLRFFPSSHSDILKPRRISLPQLRPTRLSNLDDGSIPNNMIKQYEFPLKQGRYTEKQRGIEARPVKKKTKSDKSIRKKLSESILEKEQRDDDSMLHSIILNAVLTEEIDKTLALGSNQLLQQVPKRRFMRILQEKSSKSPPRKIKLQNLQSSILLPRILPLKPSRLQETIRSKVAEMHGNKAHQKQQKDRQKVFDFDFGNIDGWKGHDDDQHLDGRL